MAKYNSPCISDVNFKKEAEKDKKGREGAIITEKYKRVQSLIETYIPLHSYSQITYSV